jgi:uncharacterized phage-associated protein
MARIRFRFNREKAIEVILYVAQRVPDSTSHSVNKILYFADKLSLERYGRLIVGGDYYAMEHGPVSSQAYRLIQNVRDNIGDNPGFSVRGKASIVPLRNPDLDYLSQADLECLDEALAQFARSNFSSRTDASHDAAYHSVWDKRQPGKKAVMLPVENIVSTLNNGEVLLDYLRHHA